MNKSTLMGVVGGLAVGILVGTFVFQSGGNQQEAGDHGEVSGVSPAQETVVNWSMPSSFPATMLIAGTGGKDWIYWAGSFRSICDWL